MKEKLAKILQQVKDFWGKLTPKIKKLIVIGGLGAVATIVLLTIVFSATAQKMVALYPKLSTVETSAVSSALSELGVNAQISSSGEIMVPAEQKGELQLQLAGKGYPQSAPTYGLYLDNTGFMRTESEKKQIYIYQLQEDLRGSLVQTKGVKNATVIISLPDNSGYVWDTDKGESSASVTITMEPGMELSSERVSAIKNLVAYSVQPQIKPDNVKVIDASTGVELLPDESEFSAAGLNMKRLEYEGRVKKNIEDNVKRLLSPIYGAEGVTAVAWVTLDYDKMLTQQHQVVPGDDGNGVKGELDEKYTLSGQTGPSGIVGEQDNTDTPSYPNQDGEGAGGLTDYERRIVWENSFIDTQIEKGQAILKEATISVVVNDKEFTQDKQDSLTNMISKSVNIAPQSISVTNYAIGGNDVPVVTQPQEMDQMLLIAIGAAGLLLLLLLMLTVILLRRRSKKNRLVVSEEAASMISDSEAEIARLKQQLRESAQENDKENAIANEVREFAKENPEITANLIRSLLKEDE